MAATSAGRATPEFAPVELRSFAAGKPPLLDLYHLVGDQYILYCEGQAVFAEDARRRLLENGVAELYVRVTAGQVDAGGLSLPDILALPDSQVPPLLKAGILYSSAISAARTVFAAPGSQEGLSIARWLVGTIVASLTRDPSTLRILAQMMRHDFSLYSHSVNVCAYATILGDALGIERGELFNVGLGAFLHDVGKTRIPQAILAKPGPLSEREWSIVRRHPEWGVQLLGAETHKWVAVRVVVLQHHELLDGSGYPEGLRGQEIHPLGRLVTLVDVYDALTSERPHRPALSPFEALRTIKGEMAGKVDHELFATFVQTLGHHGGEGEPNSFSR